MATDSRAKRKYDDDNEDHDDTKSVEDTGEECGSKKSKHGDDDDDTKQTCDCGFCALPWFQPGTVLVAERHDLWENQFHLFSVERQEDSKGQEEEEEEEPKKKKKVVNTCQNGVYASRDRKVMSCKEAFETKLRSAPSHCRWWIGFRGLGLQEVKRRVYEMQYMDPRCKPPLPSVHFHRFPDDIQPGAPPLALLATPIVLDHMGFAKTTKGIWDPVQPVFKKDQGERCEACDKVHE